MYRQEQCSRAEGSQPTSMSRAPPVCLGLPRTAVRRERACSPQRVELSLCSLQELKRGIAKDSFTLSPRLCAARCALRQRQAISPGGLPAALRRRHAPPPTQLALAKCCCGGGGG